MPPPDSRPRYGAICWLLALRVRADECPRPHAARDQARPRARGRASRLEPDDVAVELAERRRPVLGPADGAGESCPAPPAGCTPHAAKLRAALKDTRAARSERQRPRAPPTLADSLAIPFVSNRKGLHGFNQRLHQRRGAKRGQGASPSSASGTAPTRSCRASTATRTPTPDQFVPGLMHVDLGSYHVETSSSTPSTSPRTRSGRIWPSATNDTYKFADVPKTGVKVSRGMTHDGLGKYLSESSRRLRAIRTTSRGSSAKPARTSSSTTSVGSRRRPSGTRSRSCRRLRDGELHASLHREGRPLPRSASRTPACRSSATTSSRRSARRSRTASSRASSASAACTSTGRCS